MEPCPPNRPERENGHRMKRISVPGAPEASAGNRTKGHPRKPRSEEAEATTRRGRSDDGQGNVNPEGSVLCGTRTEACTPGEVGPNPLRNWSDMGSVSDPSCNEKLHLSHHSQRSYPWTPSPSDRDGISSSDRACGEGRKNHTRPGSEAFLIIPRRGRIVTCSTPTEPSRTTVLRGLLHRESLVGSMDRGPSVDSGWTVDIARDLDTQPLSRFNSMV